MCHHAGKNKIIECTLFLIHSIFRIALILSKSSKTNCFGICQEFRQWLCNQLVERLNSHTFRGGVRNEQSINLEVVVTPVAVAVLLSAVVVMTVVEGGGVVD